jgi:hypothetical protein
MAVNPTQSPIREATATTIAIIANRVAGCGSLFPVISI